MKNSGESGYIYSGYRTAFSGKCVICSLILKNIRSRSIITRVVNGQQW